MAGQVHYEVQDHIATVTLDNQKARNAFDHEMCLELKRLWGVINDDPDVRCAIVTGAGEKAFCTGWDISSNTTGEAQDFAKHGRKAAPYNNITAVQNQCWTPVITAVNGMCNGGGLHFIADTDIAIGADTSTYFDTHCANGLAAIVEMVGLARKVPLDAVFRLIYMGSKERMTAEDALRLGLIGEIVPAVSLLDRAREIAENICSMSPASLARSKQAVWQSLDMGLEDALEATHKILDVHADHPDTIEGPTAFFEKRAPNWAPFDGKAVDLS
ncbi:MAG: enoyl-CoA hydratase/isomerase family protein [Myxococcota bacterium]